MEFFMFDDHLYVPLQVVARKTAKLYSPGNVNDQLAHRTNTTQWKD